MRLQQAGMRSTQLYALQPGFWRFLAARSLKGSWRTSFPISAIATCLSQPLRLFLLALSLFCQICSRAPCCFEDLEAMMTEGRRGALFFFSALLFQSLHR